MSRSISFAALLCFVCAVSAIAFAQDKAKHGESRVSLLQRKHASVCRQRFDDLDRAYTVNTTAIEYSDLLAAHQKKLEAELELADGYEGKTLILNEAIRWQQGLERRLSHDFARGTHPHQGLLEVQISRLELEIELAKLEAVVGK